MTKLEMTPRVGRQPHAFATKVNEANKGVSHD